MKLKKIRTQQFKHQIQKDNNHHISICLNNIINKILYFQEILNN